MLGDDGTKSVGSVIGKPKERGTLGCVGGVTSGISKSIELIGGESGGGGGIVS